MKLLLFLCSLLLPLFQRGAYGLKQYIEFYNVRSCANSPERSLLYNTLGVRPNTTTIPFQSINIFGLWQIGVCTSANCNPVGTLPQDYIVYGSNTGTCEVFNGSTTNGLEVRRLGDPAMNLAELQLFDQVNFSPGGRVVVVTNQGLPSLTIDVKSLFFTGDHSWELFEEVDHRGRGVCVWPGSDVRRLQYGITANATTELGITIRSIRYGCSSSNKQTTFSIVTLLLIFVTHLVICNK